MADECFDRTVPASDGLWGAVALACAAPLCCHPERVPAIRKELPMRCAQPLHGLVVLVCTAGLSLTCTHPGEEREVDPAAGGGADARARADEEAAETPTKKPTKKKGKKKDG